MGIQISFLCFYVLRTTFYVLVSQYIHSPPLAVQKPDYVVAILPKLSVPIKKYSPNFVRERWAIAILENAAVVRKIVLREGSAILRYSRGEVIQRGFAGRERRNKIKTGLPVVFQVIRRHGEY